MSKFINHSPLLSFMLIAKYHLKMVIGIVLFLFLIASFGVVSMYIEVQEVKTRMDTKDFNDMLYDPGNIIILHVSEQEDYCRMLLNST